LFFFSIGAPKENFFEKSNFFWRTLYVPMYIKALKNEIRIEQKIYWKVLKEKRK
jgi:hypothetical protein